MAKKGSETASLATCKKPAWNPYCLSKAQSAGHCQIEWCLVQVSPHNGQSMCAGANAIMLRKVALCPSCQVSWQGASNKRRRGATKGTPSRSRSSGLEAPAVRHRWSEASAANSFLIAAGAKWSTATGSFLGVSQTKGERQLQPMRFREATAAAHGPVTARHPPAKPSFGPASPRIWTSALAIAKRGAQFSYKAIRSAGIGAIAPSMPGSAPLGALGSAKKRSTVFDLAPVSRG